MANQIIQWTFGSLRGKPGVLQVALDEATLFEHPADARGDLLQQCRKLGGRWRRQMTEHRRRAFDRHEYAVSTIM